MTPDQREFHFEEYKRVSDALEARIKDSTDLLKYVVLNTTEECAKYGWRAESQGQSFNFCTATRGYADFRENGSLIQCNQYLSAQEAEDTYKPLSSGQTAESPPSSSAPTAAPQCRTFVRDQKLPLTGYLTITDQKHEESEIGRPVFMVFLDIPLCDRDAPSVLINSVDVTSGSLALLGRHVSFVGTMVAGDAWSVHNSRMTFKSER